jgi:hypothetical protein
MVGATVFNLSKLDEFSSPQWTEFASHYRHLSKNSVAFEIACIRRYFYVLYIAESLMIDDFIIMDTDVLLFPSAPRYMSVMPRLTFSRVVEGGEIEHVSPHFSRWTRHHLADFVEFLVSFYKGDLAIGVLEMAKSHGGSVSDMVLLSCWLSERGYDWSDSAAPMGGFSVDHNVSLTYQSSRRAAKVPFVTATEADGGVRFGRHGPTYVALHFQGAAKKLMAGAERNGVWAMPFGLTILGIARLIRSKMVHFSVR